MIIKRTSQFGGEDAVDAEDLDIDLNALFEAVSKINPGAPTPGRACENLDAVWIVHTFGGAANVDETVPHKLGRTPVGLIPVEMPTLTIGSAPVVGTVTFGTIPPTASLVTLRCSAALKRAAVILF